jgi:hypothetical protein
MSKRSLFGINLLTQFVLFLLCAGFVEQLPTGLREAIELVMTLLFTSFLFGAFYGIFRLLGARSGGLEWFYQRFPCGFFLDSEVQEAPKDTEPIAVDVGFDWKALCSFRTLRVAGMLLIVTAAFSLLFTIEWQLIQKIIVALVLGLASLGGAELLKRKGKARWPSHLSLLGFLLLQFTLTLLAVYAAENSWGGAFQNPHVWLTLKFLLTCACLFTLWRYPGEAHPHLYFLVAYLSPMSLLYVGAIIDFPIGLVFVALMSAIVLSYATMHRLASLWIVNALAANVFSYYLFAYAVVTGGNMAPSAILALVAFAAFFATHLSVAIAGAKSEHALDKAEYTHLIVIHALMGLGIFLLQETLPYPAYHGFLYVIVGVASFIATFAAGPKLKDKAFRDMLLNLAIIFSTIGLFVQTTGPWSGVAFLLYACAVLWLSLHTASLRTRVYGFIVLAVSLVKLYLQFSEIFSSIPGSLAVLAIGVILVALSYKFESLKDLVMRGLPPNRN